VAGLTGKNPITASRKVVIVPDTSLAEVTSHSFDAIILPGGLAGAKSMAQVTLQFYYSFVYHQYYHFYCYQFSFFLSLSKTGQAKL